MRAAIQPVQVWPGTATVLAIGMTQIASYGEEGQAAVWWYLLDDNDQQLNFGQCAMSHQAYTAWGDDDTYLLNWVAQELGLTLVP